MIPLILIAGLAIVLGVPALVDPARRAAARRAAASDQRDAAARRREEDAAAAKAQLTRLWTDQPVTAGADETHRFKTRVHDGLSRQLRDRERERLPHEERMRRHQSHVRDGRPVTTGYRLRVLAGLALFLIVFVLGIGLDYLIFRGLHPSGTFLLPLALACLAVIGISAGAVLCFDATRHHLVPATATPYVRRVVAVSGAVLATGIAVYMTAIAPYRSIPAGQKAITVAEQQLASDQSQVVAGPSGSDSQLISADKYAITQASDQLAEAERVDKWSALVLAILDIPLAEAGFLGAELLILDLTVLRHKMAQRRVEQAVEDLQTAENAYVNTLHQILTQHGHANADELIPPILARVGNLMVYVRRSSAQGQLQGIGPAPALPDPADRLPQGDGPGQAGGAPAAGPAAEPPVAEPPAEDDRGSLPEVHVFRPARAPSTQPAGPGIGQEGGPPTRPEARQSPQLTVVPTEGTPAPPISRRPQDHADGAAATGADAELPPEEFDLIA
jgi:hypothetical protein